MPRYNRYMNRAHVCFYVCCSDCVGGRGVCDNICCVAAIVEDSIFSLGVLKYVVICLGDAMDVVFSVCIVRRGAVGAARLWKVLVFRHADVVCLCLV